MSHILMLTCQKLGATTGSGVVTTELASRLAMRGYTVSLVHGTNEDSDVVPTQLARSNIRLVPVEFGASATAQIPFDIVGMSNEMPYRSLRFSQLVHEKLDLYVDVWQRTLSRIIQAQQPTLVHVHHLWLLVHLVREVAPRVPLVVSLHGTELHRAADAPHILELICPALRSADAFISLSQEMVAEACGVFGIDRSRVVVLGNGFDSENFRPVRMSNHGESVPPLAKIPDTSRLVTFAGKFARWKGLSHLIRAFAKLRKSSLTNIHLAIAGTGPETERQRYRALVSELQLDDQVSFLGHLAPTRLAELFRRTRVFVLPSFREPFGLVLLEALACGCRIVASDHGGPTEFVPRTLRSNGYATLVPGLTSETPAASESAQYEEALAHAIEVQLSSPVDSTIRRVISDSVQHLNWNSYVDQLEKVYGRLSHEVESVVPSGPVALKG